MSDDKSIRDFENMVEYEQSIEDARARAEAHIMNWYEMIAEETIEGICKSVDAHEVIREEIDELAYKDKEFFEAIWHASTEILPALEVQVVIDGNNNCHVTTGSAGYVEFGMKPPIGMKLPIKCWFHTHPFGSAYFSGTDWTTVAIWEPVMKTAYVIGGDDHYGFWENTKPKQLEIKQKDGNYRIQMRAGEEE